MYSLLIGLLPAKLQAIFAKENVNRAASNTLWLVGDKVIRIIITIFLTAYLSRYLGVENFGKLNNAIAWYTLFGAFATMGLDSLLIRDLVRNPEDKERILGTGLGIRAIASLICYTLCLVTVYIESPGEADSSFRIITAIISIGMLFQSFDIIDYYFQSQTASKNTVIAKLSAFVLSSGAKAYLIYIQAGLESFAWIWMLEFFVSALLITQLYRSKENSIRAWSFDRVMAGRLIKEGAPIFVAYVASYTYMKFDQIIVGRMLGYEAAGLFSASARLYEMCFLIITVITPSIYPSLINIHDRPELFFKRYQQITSVFSFLGYGLVIGTMLLAPFIINLQYGAEYDASANILRLQIFGMLFMFNGGLRSSYLAIINRQDIIMVTSILSAILNITLNLLLIPVYGVMGSAWATVITVFLAIFIGNVLYKDTHVLFRMQLNGFMLKGALKFAKFINPNKP